MALHWSILGSMFVGERGITSPRTQRTLPSTFLGRLFLTWTNPGGGTGYIFTIATYAGLYIASCINMTIDDFSVTQSADSIMFGGFLLSYMVIYLGLARLVMLALPKSIGFSLRYR